MILWYCLMSCPWFCLGKLYQARFRAMLLIYCQYYPVDVTPMVQRFAFDEIFCSCEGHFPAGYVEYSFEILWEKSCWGDYDVVTPMSCLVPTVSDFESVMIFASFGSGGIDSWGSRRDHSATRFCTDSTGIAKHFFRGLKLYTVGWSARSRKCEHVIHQKEQLADLRVSMGKGSDRKWC